LLVFLLEHNLLMFVKIFKLARFALPAAAMILLPVISYAAILKYGDVIDYSINIEAGEVLIKSKGELLLNDNIINPVTERISSTTLKLYSGEQFYKEGNMWYQIDYATTTTELFIDAQITYVEKFRYLLGFIKTAIADTLYPSNDNSICYEDATYETMHDATNGENVILGGVPCGAGGAEELFTSYSTGSLYRSLLYFDTSVIGAGNQVDTASLSIKRAEASGTATSNIYGSTATGITASNGDFSSCGSTGFSTAVAPWTNGTYQEFVFNATGEAFINTTGSTMFCHRFVGDAESHDAPGATNYIGINASETTGTGSDPYLVVTYSPVPTPTPSPGVATSTIYLLDDPARTMFWAIILFITGFSFFYWLLLHK